MKKIDFLKNPEFCDLSEHGEWSREWPQPPCWCRTSWCNLLNPLPALAPCENSNSSVLVTFLMYTCLHLYTSKDYIYISYIYIIVKCPSIMEWSYTTFSSQAQADTTHPPAPHFCIISRMRMRRLSLF